MHREILESTARCHLHMTERVNKKRPAHVVEVAAMMTGVHDQDDVFSTDDDDDDDDDDDAGDDDDEAG